MELTEFIAAIDLGSSKIIGALGVCSKDVTGSVTVYAIEHEESGSCIKRGCIQNVEDAAGKVKSVINKLQYKTHSEISKIYVGIGGQSLYTINHKEIISFDEDTQITDPIINSIKESCLKVIIPGKDVLDVVPTDYVIDGTKIEKPVGVYGARIEANVKLIIGRSNLKKNIQRMAEKLQIPIAGIILSPIAAASVLSEPEKRLGCTLIDFGAATTTISFYKDAVLRHLAVIPIGGNTVTKDITSLRVLEDKAEDIKKTFGTASPEYTEDDDKLLKAKNSANTDALELPMRTIHDVVLSRYDEIMENVLNQARLAGFKQQPASYVITGGGANMKGLPELIRSKTGSEAKKAIFPTAVMSKVHNDCDSDPTLSVLVGMLLSGTENCCKE